MADDYNADLELQAGDVVGDNRKIRLLSVDPGSGGDGFVIGEVWQDDDGELQGSGVAAVMLFEPLSSARYRLASVTADMSPLAMFYARVSSSPFMRAEVVEE